MNPKKGASTEVPMRELVRQKDWASTPLGPADRWPQSLRTLVELCLDSKFPTVIFWGPELVQIYNDGYRVILGATKHPIALGQRAAECWAEMWSIIGPMLASVSRTGEAVWIEESVFSLQRYGYLEEAYFTFSFSPVRDESGSVGGICETVAEDTLQVLSHRRLAALRELAESRAVRIEEACAAAASTFSKHGHDLPFVLLYRLDDDGRAARLCGNAGLEPGLPASPETISLGGVDPWHLGEALKTGAPVVLRGLGDRLGRLPGGPWPDPAHTAVVLPIESPGGTRPFGFLVAGLSPRRALDEAYFDFLRLAVKQLSSSLASARAYEEERTRAEKLAEIDRLKTAFFSNVSHEFRTPLTLILGPVEDALARSTRSLQGQDLEAVHRSSLRLLRLVNSLLDFARLESGRVQMCFTPTDLSALTIDLASSFRSLVESAGLKLIVDCPPLAEPVYVDLSQWEKIVLNLVSNAFKFTHQGEIHVSLRLQNDQVKLTVRDTGIGIPAHDLPHVFERFHRVEGARGRSFEGTGIGLSLVQELVKLHGGTVGVSSVEGEGSSFRVTLPGGKAHLPLDRIRQNQEPVQAGAAAAAYLLEAAQWSALTQGTRAPESTGGASLPSRGTPSPAPGQGLARVLVADDNSDMRDYLARLLSQEWRVDAVADGEAALDLARKEPPDLVLSDVMMPKMDGCSLLRALRADPRTSRIPVILLSARAGEDAVLEGLQTGADDYLVKPFSARELLARVRTHLELARVRREWADQLQRANEELEAFSYSVSHDLRAPLRALDGYAQILLEDQAGKLDAEGKQALSKIVEGAGRMEKLIDDLLEFSRLGKAPLQAGLVDMNALSRTALQEVLSGSPGRKIAVSLLSMPRAWGDPSLLRQVLANLIGNAVKYTGPREAATVEIGGSEQATENIYYVKDNGVGFDMQDSHKLFRVFQRLHSSKEFEGTGVGLALVQRVIERHGGRVWAEGEAGKGATFRFTLPRKGERSPPA